MSDKLADALWPKEVDIDKKKVDDPKELVIEALRRALDNTTPERPGSPWDAREKEPNDNTGWWIPGSEE